MARYRKRRVFRRRIRRPFRRIRKRRGFKRGLGDCFCKLTQINTYDVNLSTTTVIDLQAAPDDIEEYRVFSENFEYAKFLKCKVRVFPHQNVSNNSSSSMPNYCMLPWHPPSAPVSKRWAFYATHDKAKVFRGTQKGRQYYTCSGGMQGYGTTSGNIAYNLINWKPQVRYDPDRKDQPIIRTGIVAFQGEPTRPAGDTAKYTIMRDWYVVFKNQSLLNRAELPSK